MLNKERFKFVPRTKKRLILVVLILSLLLIVAGYMYANKTKQDNKAEYVTAPVQQGSIELSIDGSGTLQPSERYALKTKASGTVQEILVNEGDQVKKGQPLLRLQNDEVMSQAKQAHLEWEIEQDNLTEMFSPTTETDFDYRTAQLKVEQCQIALEDKQEEKDKLILKAPFTGTILTNEVLSGQRVNTGTTAVTFATTEEIEVVAQFSEKDINMILEGMETDISVPGLNKTLHGKVKEKAFQGTVNTDERTGGTNYGTFEVIITVDNPIDDLRPGMKTWNTVYVVKGEELPDFVFKQASGYIRYTQSEDIVTEVNGTIEEIYHKPGDKVSKGEPLLRLKNNEIEHQLKEAENQLANAKEELELLLSPDENKIKQQELRTEESWQKILVTEEQVNSLNVTAPIDGIVVNLSVQPGEELNSGQEIIAISNFEQNSLEIPVDELDINKIKLEQQAIIKIDALPDTTLNGKVTGIAQEGNTDNGGDGVTKYPITLEVGYAEGIKGGMTATATILIDKKENVLRIPAEALVSNNGKTLVRVLQNEQVQMKPIKTGLNNGRWVEVINGLKEGEQVITASVSSQQTVQAKTFNKSIPGGKASFGGSGRLTPRGK